MWRNLASNALSLMIVAVVVLIAVVVWGQRQFTGSGPLTEAAYFEVPRGASLRRVSDALAERGIVSSATLFRIGTEYSDKAGDLKFGNYEIPAGASMADVMTILTEGGGSSFRYLANFVIGINSAETRLMERAPGFDEIETLAVIRPGEPVPPVYSELVAARTPMQHRVTVVPGVTSWQVAESLKQVDFLDGEIASLPDEGALSPDSYDVSRGDSRQALIETMASRQADTLAAAWENRDAGIPIKTPEEALILASIIEKETGKEEERRLVSSVFTNRLNEGMRLQTDPTVIYGITNGQGVLGRGLRQSELRKVTPYNTYVIQGLPPTPIANPGKAAIEAAVSPDSTDFIFFVADGTGGHAFAATLAEHNQNVAKWRQIERDRQSN